MHGKPELKDAMILIAFGVLLFVGATHLPAVWGAVAGVCQLLMPLLMGALFAFVLNVPMSGFERMFMQLGKKLGKKLSVVPVRVVSLLLTLAGIALAFTMAVALVIPELVSSVRSIIPLVQERLPEWIEFAADQGLDVTGLTKQLQSFDIGNLSTSMPSLMGSAVHIATNTVTSVGSAALGLVIAVYLLLGKHNFCRQALMLAMAHLPERVVYKWRYVCNLVNKTYAKFLSGQFVEAIILGCLMYCSFKLFRLPYAGLTAYLTGLCAFVPYVGAALSCAAAAVLTLLVAPQKVIICVVVYLVTQFIENQFIYPRVVGGSVGLAPMWTLVAALIGGKLFGVVGIVFFIPLASVVYTLVREDTYRRLARGGEDAADA